MAGCSNCGPEAPRRGPTLWRTIKWGGAALAVVGVLLQLPIASVVPMATPIGGALMGMGLAGWLLARLFGRRSC